jgi:hypothetical protein
MNRLYLVALCLLIFQTTILAQQINFEKRLIIQFHSRSGGEAVVNSFSQQRSNGLQWKRISSSLHIWILSWETDITKEEIKKDLESYSDILYVQNDAEVYNRNINEPNDPQANIQWYLDKIKAKRAWTQSTGGYTIDGDTIVIAVLEREGPEVNHEDLLSQFWVNKTETPNDGIDNDNNGYTDDYKGLNISLGSDKHPADIKHHATPVCGILGATGNNNTGVAGINWNIKILMVSNVQTVGQIVEAYEYIIDMRKRYDTSGGTEGAYIVASNASFGRDNTFPEEFPSWCAMYDVMGSNGIMTAVATSNNNVNIGVVGDLPTLCPSPFIIGVTNTTEDDMKAKDAGFSKEHIDLGAPGINIHTTNTNNSYSVAGGTDGGGTSFSTPLVTGAIALLYSMPSPEFTALSKSNPSEASLLIKQYILDGVDKTSNLDERTLSGGRLNLERSMILLSQEFGNIEEQLSLDKLMPNPARNRLKYVFKGNEFVDHDILIVNMLGQVVLQDKIHPIVFGDPELEIDISRLVPGQYILTVRNIKEVRSKPFIKMDDL